MAMHLFHPDAMLSNELRCRNTAIAKLKAIATTTATTTGSSSTNLQAQLCLIINSFFLYNK